MKHLLVINGSYRDNGIIDQAVDIGVQAATSGGARVEVVRLREFPIEFCVNCRTCCQEPGERPGVCIHHDRMHELVEKIEAADAYILASPTNFSSATALFKRFMERLTVYAYWPWGAPAPKFRKANPRKKAILIASCAAPGLLGRVFYSTLKQLKMTAKTIGARPTGSVFIGLIAKEEQTSLPASSARRIRKLVARL